MRPSCLVATLLAVLPSYASAQSLAERVRAVGDGAVRLSFASRPGVCGTGSSITITHGDDDDDWQSDCERGPVRVSLRLQGGRVTKVETRVAGRWRETAAGSDLGLVPAKEAS
ncbi:MAG TPA: hypothetical protein VEB59_06190, partial [Gemmatimonadales bacterium]|nr:hypothetical protein [Gemmatimonadales bacterium]